MVFSINLSWFIPRNRGRYLLRLHHSGVWSWHRVERWGGGGNCHLGGEGSLMTLLIFIHLWWLMIGWYFFMTWIWWFWWIDLDLMILSWPSTTNFRYSSTCILFDRDPDTWIGCVALQFFIWRDAPTVASYSDRIRLKNIHDIHQNGAFLFQHFWQVRVTRFL